MAKSRQTRMLAVLNPAYPDVVFSFETMSPSHRNSHTNFRIYWEGGPKATEVEALLRDKAPDTFISQATKGFGRFKVGFNRSASDAERAAWIAEYDAGEPARKAAREAEKRQNKLDGIKQRGETAVERKALIAKLTERFPGVAFKVNKIAKGYRYSRWAVEWTGGPSKDKVETIDGVCGKRFATQAEIDAYHQKAQREHDRCARRLAELVAMGKDDDLELGAAPQNWNLERINVRWREATGERRRLATMHEIVRFPARRVVARNPVKVAATQARRMMRERLIQQKTEHRTISLQMMLPLDLPPVPAKPDPLLVMLRQGCKRTGKPVSCPR